MQARSVPKGVALLKTRIKPANFSAGCLLAILTLYCTYHHVNFKTIRVLRKQVNLNWGKITIPNSDRLSFLPQETISMIAMLNKHHVTSYRFSTGIKSNDLVAQRMIEGALPLSYNPESQYYFLLGNETLPQGCSLVDSSGDINLAHCV